MPRISELVLATGQVGKFPVVESALTRYIDGGILKKSGSTYGFTAGNVGIGTLTPGAVFHVTGTSGDPATSGTSDPSNLLRVQFANVAVDQGIYGAGTAWWQVRHQGALGTTFDMSLQPVGGSVGIGTTTTVPAKLSVNGVLAIVDGIAAPSATIGWAKLYVDTADGDLKVRFGDGTIKTISTDT